VRVGPGIIPIRKSREVIIVKSELEKLWRRRPQESADAYEGFLAYRDLGSKRSIELASRKCNKHASICGRWSTKWGWVARARAWDNDMQEARDEVQRKWAAQWEERRVVAISETYEIGLALQEKAKKMMAMPLVETRVEKDGKVTILKPAKWTYQSVTEMLRLAHDLLVTSTGSAANPVEQCGDTELEAIEEANYAAKAVEIAKFRAGRLGLSEVSDDALADAEFSDR
jgi:hypothetical protein